MNGAFVNSGSVVAGQVIKWQCSVVTGQVSTGQFSDRAVVLSIT